VTDSILDRISAGDESAMEACVDRYGGLIWSLARRLSPSASEAEDAVQEIFIEIWESAFRFRPECGSELTFIATIARRRLIDRLRSDQRRRGRMEEVARRMQIEQEKVPRIPRDAPSRFDEVSRVRAAMERLLPEQQRVLQMAIHHGCTHDQIAGQTGLPLGTVKTHARRGLQRLRELLGVPPIPVAEAGRERGRP
jgi:RNA polymerase sigma factor (sigma-70 family)